MCALMMFNDNSLFCNKIFSFSDAIDTVLHYYTSVVHVNDRKRDCGMDHIALFVLFVLDVTLIAVYSSFNVVVYFISVYAC
jgi:hypothetical protein